MSSRSAWGLIVRFEPAWHTATLSPVDDLEDLLFMDLRSLRSWICDHSNQAGRPAVRDLIIRELLIDRGYGPGVWPGDHLDSRGGGIGMSAGAGRPSNSAVSTFGELFGNNSPVRNWLSSLSHDTASSTCVLQLARHATPISTACKCNFQLFGRNWRCTFGAAVARHRQPATTAG